jgi:hypothetical protein
VSLIDHPISQPSLDISPIWTFIIAAEITKLQLRPFYILRGSCVFYVVTTQTICIFSDSDGTLI